MSGLSNQSHDSQASSSTASATSQDEKRGMNNTGVQLNNGQGHEEEELDEMEVEYSEVSCTIIVRICECLSMFYTCCNYDLCCTCTNYCIDCLSLCEMH